MQIKKLLKYLPMTVMATCLAVATSTPPLSLLNNSDYLKNQIFNVDQAVDETEYTDQLEYIRNDVAKQDGVTNSVASIKLADDDSSSSESSAALVTKTDGSTLLYMWGRNEYGQLGNGTKITSSTPTLVDLIPFGSRKITQIALGYRYSGALLDDGSLYMWGENTYGQLGNGTKLSASTPTPVDSTLFGSKKVTQIALGEIHSAALLDDDNLYTWGSNTYGQLGNGNTGGSSTSTSTPTLVDSTLFGSRKITQIALGGYHSSAFLEDDSLYMWGSNEFGQLGNETNVGKTTPNPTPAKVTIPNYTARIAQIALGGWHSAAIVTKTDRSTLLYMWGQNATGQLGNTTNSGTSTPTPTPTLVDSTPFGTNKITQIALGAHHSAALLEDKSLYMWGRNEYGQLGFTANGTTPNPAPTLVDSKLFGSRKITQIALGFRYSAAFLEDGSLYMWGYNYHGQLGNEINVGTSTPNPTPTRMFQLGKDSHITANTTITAQAAVDNIWVDNKFNLTGFKNSFNLINIPETTDQEITMDTKPTYDNVTGTVTMTVKIKYFYNEDGLLVPDTAAEEMAITGFTLPVAEDQNPATDNQDPFPWWWIIIGIGGAAIIGVGIWFIIKKRKEADAKSAEGEPKPEKPKDGEPKPEEPKDGEPKPEEKKTSESENKPEAAKSEEEVQSEATENKLKNKLTAKLDAGKLKAKSKIDQATKWVKTSKDNITSKLKTPDIED